jgi:2-methylisocitrate lyase-like PEP mutase family enzyme
MPTQLEKGRAFAALHAQNEVFVMPNPWDLGSARVPVTI